MIIICFIRYDSSNTVDRPLGFAALPNKELLMLVFLVFGYKFSDNC
jgi:hypothetical protein